MDRTVLPANYTMPAFCFASVHQMAPRLTEAKWRLIGACYSFIDPEGMKRWVGLVGWPIADGLPT